MRIESIGLLVHIGANGLLCKPAPPKTMRARETFRQTASNCFNGARKKCAHCMFWSSMFLTEMPMTSGCSCAIAFRIAVSPVASDANANSRTSCPACSVAAVTHAKPSGKGVSRPLVTLLLEMSSTLTTIPPPSASRWHWQSFKTKRATLVSSMSKLPAMTCRCHTRLLRYVRMPFRFGSHESDGYRNL